MTFYTCYNAVLEGAKEILEKIQGIQRVVIGEQFRVEKLPMVVVDPAVTPINRGSIGSGTLQLALRFNVVYVVANTEPEDWREDVAKPLAGIVDEFISNRTLGGAVKDTFPRRFAPNAQIPLGSAVMYGGLVEFESTLFYVKT